MRKHLKILNILEATYEEPRSELDFTNNFQLLVAVVLSAQCTDKKVNQVTPELFKKYSNFEELANAELSQVEKILRPVNYYKTKSRNLIALAKLICEKFNQKVPLQYADLLSLPGVGNKTANVVLSETGTTHTLPVDTHVFRVSKRLGLAKGKKVEQVEKELREIFVSADWRKLHHWLIFHGRRVCKARNPACGECKLKGECEYFKSE